MSLGRALFVGSGWWLHSEVHFGCAALSLQKSSQYKHLSIVEVWKQNSHHSLCVCPWHHSSSVCSRHHSSWSRWLCSLWSSDMRRFRLPSSRSGSFWLRLAASSTAVSSAVLIRKCFALAGTWLKYEAVTHKFQLWLFEPHFEIFGQTRAKSCSLLWFMFKSKSTKCGDIKDCYSTSV